MSRNIGRTLIKKRPPMRQTGRGGIKRKHIPPASHSRLFKTIEAHIPGIVYRRVLHPDGAIAYPYISEGVRTIYGLSPEDVMRDSALLLERIHPQDRDGFYATLRRSAERLSLWEYEFRMIDMRGDHHWMAGRSTPARESNGNIVWDGFLLEITARKRMEEQVQAAHENLERSVYERTEQLAREIDERCAAENALREHQQQLTDFLEADSDWFWEMDANLRFTYFSESITRVLGVRPYEHLGKTRSMLRTSDDDAEAWARHMDDLTSRRPFRDFQFRLRRTDGSVRIVKTSGKPLFDDTGKFAGYRGTGTDITEKVAAEERALLLESYLRQAINSMRDGFALWGPDDCLVLCNDVYRSFSDPLAIAVNPGTSFETVSRAVLDWKKTHGEDFDYDQQLAQRLEIHRAGRQLFDIYAANNRWYQVTERRLEDGSTVGIYTDITERKEIEQALAESEAKLRAIYENVPDAIVIFDEKGMIQAFNPAVERIFGYSRTAILGRSLDILTADYGADAGSFIHHYLQSLSGSSIGLSREITGQRKDGTVFSLEITISEVAYPNGRMFAGVMRDITGWKDAQETLLMAKAEAESANRAKSNFLSSMSHELRTPLNAVLGFGQILDHIPDEPLKPRQRQYIDYILESGQHLLTLINQVLDLASIEAGRTEIAPVACDLGEILDQCMVFTLPLAQPRGIAISCMVEVGALPPVHADKMRTKQVLLNLISNSIKYNREGGSVKIEGKKAPNGMVRVLVSDTGPGIPKERMKDLFRPFSRLDARHSSVEGSGIGLALSRQLVELMGGRIDVNSEPGQGSTFWFELPPAPAWADFSI